MIRTLWVTNDLPPRAGGIESFVGSLLERTHDGGAHVVGPPHPAGAAHDAGLPWTTERLDRAVQPTPAVLRRVREAAARHRPDAVVLGASWPLGELAPSLAREPGVPVVGISHGLEAGLAGAGLGRAVVARTTRHLAALTTISDWTEARLAPHARCPVHRVAPGVDTSRFRPQVSGAGMRVRWGVPAGATVVGCISRLVRRKGQDVLLAAWPRIAADHPDAWLVLAGEGPLAEELARAASGLERVRLVGRVAEEDLPAAHAAFDVFAMPCRTRLLGTDVEGLGIVYLEAQAAGVPVVAGRSGGAPETVLPGRTGVTVDGADPDAVATALRSYLSDPTLRAQHGAAGRAHAERVWSTEAVADRFRAVLVEVVGEARAGK